MNIVTRGTFWHDVADKDWTDWKWQMRHRITTVDQLRKVFPEIPTVETEQIDRVLTHFRMAITPYYASLIDITNPHCPVRLQAVPSAYELMKAPEDLTDPLDEDRDTIAPHLTYRYPDRVLMLLTEVCNMYCRHCTRRRKVGEVDAAFDDEIIDQQVAAIAARPQVRDIVLSGGDPLTLNEAKLEKILRRLRDIPHVEILRLGTRAPVVNPFRITPSLLKMMRKYQPIYINTHFNHYKELTPEAVAACEGLADAGFPLGNQSVLLAGVNDSPGVMKKLVHELLKARVRPYYLYQCDLSVGISHFRTSIGKGIEIIEALRGHTSGLGVPTYVVDCPAGGGKVPVGPQYVLSRSDNKVIFRNYEGQITVYPEPVDHPPTMEHDPATNDPKYQNNLGPSRLLRDSHFAIEPSYRDLDDD
ncbi:MAG: lysine 2,3-aminomutase [Candidatus Lernaella stagnicola]|nr:lysine 2,3-aminomutase [Candidatus Lernaella stagnicola]